MLLLAGAGQYMVLYREELRHVASILGKVLSTLLLLCNVNGGPIPKMEWAFDGNLPEECHGLSYI